jgi:hypothetical protein
VAGCVCVDVDVRVVVDDREAAALRVAGGLEW